MNPFELHEYRNKVQRERDEAYAAYHRGDRGENGHLKHIVCEGARFHVVSYGLMRIGPKAKCIVTCSEPDCELNFQQEKTDDR